MQQNLIDALRRGDFAAAAAAARQLIEAEPENADAYHLHGLARHGQGDLDGARACFDQAIALAPDRAAFHMSRAQLALAERQVDQARGELDAALKLDPNQLGAYVMLANLALSRSDLADAERQIGMALRVDPEHPHALAAQGNLEMARGNGEAALRALNRAAQRAEDDPLVVASLGLAHLAQGHHAFAEQALRRAQGLQPGNTSLRWPLVQALRAQGRNEEALPELEALLAANPGDVRARGTRGEILFGQGKTEEALADFRAILDEYPRHPMALKAAIMALSRRNDRQGARDLLEDLLKRDPLSDSLWQARLTLESNEVAAADDVLARWAAAMPESPVVHEIKARVAEGRGDFTAAEDWTDRGLGLAPDDLPLHLVKLRLELRDRPEAALERSGELLGKAGNYIVRRQLLGWRGVALDRLDRTAEAAQAWMDMLAFRAASQPLPASLPVATRVAPDGGPSPRMAWTLPGAQGERLLTLFRGHAGVVLADDRFSPTPRNDGLGPGRPGPDQSELDAQVLPAWRAGLQALGLDPATVIEWLPHWDARLHASVPGGQLLAIVRDPRDMLLNWIVYGSPQGYVLPSAEVGAQWLAHVIAPLAAHLAEGDDDLVLLRGEDIEADPTAAAARIAAWAGLAEAPDASVYARTGRSADGHASYFPPGTWKRFAEGPLAPAFAQLAQSAQALGY